MSRKQFEIGLLMIWSFFFGTVLIGLTYDVKLESIFKPEVIETSKFKNEYACWQYRKDTAAQNISYVVNLSTKKVFTPADSANVSNQKEYNLALNNISRLKSEFRKSQSPCK